MVKRNKILGVIVIMALLLMSSAPFITPLATAAHGEGEKEIIPCEACGIGSQAEPEEDTSDELSVSSAHVLLEDAVAISQAGLVEVTTPYSLDWQTIMTNGFEGAFPCVWSSFTSSGPNAYWDWYSNNPYIGSYNAFFAEPESPTATSFSPSFADFEQTLDIKSTGTISGNVSDGIDPIANLNVQALDYSTNQKIAETNTDPDGNYVLSGLPTGDYRVFACSFCSGMIYISEYYDGVYHQNEAAPVHVEAPDNTPNINFTLEVGGSISGNVSDGIDPIANLHVGAIDYSTGEWMSKNNTDAEGNYVLSGLPTGDYRVFACSSCVGMNYINEYYDGTYYWDEATPVHVEAPGGETSGINFTLEVGGTISGNVSDGIDPIANLHVQVWDYSTGEGMGDTNTDPDGNYALALPTGDYRVFACSHCSGMCYLDEYYDGTYSWDEATPVHVDAPGGETSGINFTLEVGGTISGCVTESGTGDPIPYLDVNVEDYSIGKKGWWVAGTTTDADGNYVICGLPTGDYRVFACSSCVGMIYINEYYDGTYYQNEATPVHVDAPGGETSGINFTLEVGGTISGNVSDGIDPIANLNVQALDYSTNEWMSQNNTDADGNYVLSGLPTGDYRVFACSRCSGMIYIDEYYDGTYYQDEATPVHVDAPGGETSGINFTLEVGGTISGNVSDGIDPIANLHVQALDYSTGEWMTATNTDAEGNYVLVLPTGDYRVFACSHCSGMIYIDEYYDGTYSWDEATPVHVDAPGGETSGINFTLEVGGTISGNVSDGIDPIANLHVVAMDYSTNQKTAETNTDAEGNYVICGLPTGDYRVMACSSCSGMNYINEYYDGTYYWDEATPVHVDAPGGEISGINFTLEVGGTISGNVSDGIDPIINLHVQVWDYNTGEGIGSTNTDPDGNYVLALPTGDYRVRACSSCSGMIYIDEYYDGTYYQNEATPVHVDAPGGETSGINFTLEVGGTISGNVSDGIDPIANLHVQAMDYSTNQKTAETNTDADGNYVLVLPTGDYRVMACSHCSGMNYINEYYDGTYYQDEATPIHVDAPGGETSGINFTLEVGGCISGNVSDGIDPIANLHVFAEDYDTGQWMSGTNTDPDGNYVLALPTGDYRVRACSSCSGMIYIDEYYDGTYYQNEATPVHVDAPGGETSGINFTLEVGGTISGNVSDGIDPIANLHVRASDYSTNQWMTETNTDADGNYVLVLPTGDYRVMACSSCSGMIYIDEYYDGTYYWGEATPVHVDAPGGETSGINFTLEVGGTISGNVSDGIDPIANLHVQVWDYNTGEGMGGTNTDPDGNYLLSRLPTGDYRVRACSSCSGMIYIDEYYDGTYRWDEATPVHVDAPGGETSGINFTLEVGGTISGTVKDADGLVPLANISVECKRTIDGDRDWHGASTGADGNYTIRGLPYGEYVLRSPSGGWWGAGDDNYVMEYYNNKANEGEADLVTVDGVTPNPGGIDFTLEVGGSISGNVSDGVDPIVNLHVYAEDYDTGQWMSGTNTDAEGNYVLNGLPTGDYRVRACSSCSGMNYIDEYYDGTYRWEEATPVHVEAPDNTPNINFTLEIGGTISGNVSDGIDPIANLHVVVEDYDTGQWMWGTNTDPDGNYVLALPTGDYRVFACSFCSGMNYISEYYNDVYHWDEATPVHVDAPGGETSGINFILGVGGTISGIVNDAESDEPISGALIFVVDYGSPPVFSFSELAGITASDGNYTTGGLPEGDYTVWASASGYKNEVYEGTLYGQHALPVTVTVPDDTPGINFQLDPLGTISGTVYDASTFLPLPDIRICVLNSFSLMVSNVVTDEEGNYEATAPYGEWYVRAGDLIEPIGGYGVQFHSPVIVSEGVNPNGIDFYLEAAGGSISGTVYDTSTGLPLSVPIEVSTSSDYGCSDKLVYGIAISDSEGNYEVITGLPPGDYYVSAGGAGYVTQYYSDSLTWQDAILVSDGSSGIDFSLTPAAGNVIGHVYEADGVTPVRNARVDIFTLNDKHITSCYASSRSGRYAVVWEMIRPVLPEGNFKARASATGYPEQWRYFTIYQGEDTILDFHLGATGVHISLQPTTKHVGIDEVFDLIILAEAGDQPVSGIQACIDFDPTYLEVQSVTPGDTLPDVLQNTYDNSAGTIDYSAGKLGGPFPTGTFIVATIQFSSLALTSPNTAIDFSTTSPRETKADYGGTPITGIITGGTVFVSEAVVDISVVLQGGSRPNEGWVIPITIKFFSPGADVMTDTPIAQFDLTTAKADGTANCQCAITPGTYDITVVSEHTLINVRRDVIISVPSTAVDMGTLLEGNANDDDIINISDFGILALAFMKTDGEPGYDVRADFDRNGIIDISDFGLLAVNFMMTSPIDISGE